MSVEPDVDGTSGIGDDTLVFMHLAKTGGTALRSSLRQAFPPEVSAFVYGSGDLDGSLTPGQFAALERESLQRLRLVMGHFPYGLHQRIDRPCKYATLVRDPVDRVVSLYYHFRNLPGVRFGSRGHRERWRLRWRRISLEDWVFGEKRLATDNLMVRHVAGGGSIPFGACTEDLYDRAMENVERDFAALLVTEDMIRSTLVLSQIVGRDLPTVSRVNTNPKRPALDEIHPAVVARIRELNHLDVRFHEAALDWLKRASSSWAGHLDEPSDTTDASSVRTVQGLSEPGRDVGHVATEEGIVTDGHARSGPTTTGRQRTT